MERDALADKAKALEARVAELGCTMRFGCFEAFEQTLRH